MVLMFKEYNYMNGLDIFQPKKSVIYIKSKFKFIFKFLEIKMDICNPLEQKIRVALKRDVAPN